ncbi:MAG: hypothetical protein GXO80_04415 [Chlorobi bacterium]|nr:hypothetical protein [Chlorobiota bacterium]
MAKRKYNNLKKKNTIFELRYLNYINDLTYKKINVIMIVSIILLLVLMFLDLRLRNNLSAVYTRIPSLFLAIFILIFKNFKNKKNKLIVAFLYKLFLFTILAMMYAKFLVHINTETVNLNALSIITAIFIITLEVRLQFVYGIIFYFGTFILFFIILLMFFGFDINMIKPLINVFLMTVVGFVINRVQSNLRFKNYENKFLLKAEKQKLYESNKELSLKNTELEEKNKELENFNELFIGREFRIKELRDKVKELDEKLNNK